MPYAKLNEVNIYYEIYGSEYKLLENTAVQKPTIVAIHGGPGIDHNYYEVPFFSDAADFAQVIFIDQRGNGKSIDKNPLHWNLQQWAEDIHNFCNALGLKKPFIHGVSMGGWVAQLYASLYPNDAAGIILSDTEAFLDVKAILDGYEAKGGAEIRHVAEKYFYETTPDSMQQYFEKCIPLCSNNPIPAEWMSRTILTPEVNTHFKDHELASFNLIENLKNITDPVLYLTNTTNPLHLYEAAKKTAAAMINAQVEFVEFKNCGLVAMDAKEAALNEIKRFVLNNFQPS